MKPYFTEEGWKPSNVPYLEATLVFITAVYVFETYLDYRQHQKLKEKDIPKNLRDAVSAIDEEAKLKKKDENEDEDATETSSTSLLEGVLTKFTKSQAYGYDKSTFGFITSIFFQLEEIGDLLLGLSPFFWVTCENIVESFGMNRSNEILVSVVYMFVASIPSKILHLPFELYSTFVIEEKHGFNKQTLGLFFLDKLKGLLLSLVIGSAFVSILIYIIQWGGTHFYIYVWFFMLLFTIFMMTIYPIVIQPLFNKVTPLEDGDLKTKIEALAQRLSFPLTNLFVIDGSKRSSHSNAYFYGFFKSKRIVLFDTLLKQVSTNEILAILGHELGHWKLWHTIQGFIVSQIYLLVAFFMYGYCQDNQDLFLSFGYSKGRTLIGLSLFFQTIWSPVDKILSFFLKVNSRRNEYQADKFAVDLGYANELQSGLTKISLENLSTMNPDPLYSAYHHSHPTLVERLKAVVNTKNEVDKKRE